MLNYKKVLNNTTNLLKENKLVFILTLLISLSGILFFSNILSNYSYFINHRYFISLSKTIGEIFITIQSFLYNSIISNTGESITTLFNLGNLYNNIDLNNKKLVFNIITFIIVLIMFLLTNILSSFIIFSSKKQSIKELFNGIKSNLKSIFLIDIFRILSIVIIFSIIAFISIIFSLNSLIFIIISFLLSGVLFFVLFFIYQYSLRYIIFFNNNIFDAIKNSSYLFINNLKENIINLLLLISHLFILFVIILIITLPLILINYYLINSGYNIFENINNIFIGIIILFITTLANIYIIKYINELFGNIVLNNKK